MFPKYFMSALLRFFLMYVCTSRRAARRLVNALDDTAGRGRTWFVIHIDTKAEDMQKEMLEVFMDRSNVIVMEEGRCAPRARVRACVTCVLVTAVVVSTRALFDKAACWVERGREEGRDTLPLQQHGLGRGHPFQREEGPICFAPYGAPLVLTE